MTKIQKSILTKPFHFQAMGELEVKGLTGLRGKRLNKLIKIQCCWIFLLFFN